MVETEIEQLAKQLETLRLPHKLNQYRVLEKKLAKLLDTVTQNEQQDLCDKVRQLQVKLNNCVLCGVSQCFLCGGDVAQIDTSRMSNILPERYRRSVSANYTKSKPTMKPVIITTQVSLPEPKPEIDSQLEIKPEPEHNKGMQNIEIQFLSNQTNQISSNCTENGSLPTPPLSPSSEFSCNQEVRNIQSAKMVSNPQSPLKSTNSYKAYKDFINQYSKK